MDEKCGITGTITLVLTNVKTGKVRVIKAKNIITDQGDEFYAKRSCDEQPDDDQFTTGAAKTFDGVMELGNDLTPPTPDKVQNRSAMTNIVSGSEKVIDATYPKSDDQDADNTGKGIDIATYRTSWLTSEANANDIQQIWITNPSPGASELLLMYATFSAFNKTSSDTLKVFVNHTMLGV